MLAQGEVNSEERPLKRDEHTTGASSGNAEVEWKQTGEGKDG